MTALTAAVEDFLLGYGLTNHQAERIQSGRNSRVWRIKHYDAVYILKEYFRHPNDPRDRLSTEYNFLSFLDSQGVTNIPRPLKRHPEMGIALYSCLPGVLISTISEDHIQQAARFIHKINQGRGVSCATSLPQASEACFSLLEHIERVKFRMELLQGTLIDISNQWQAKALKLLSECLWPTYNRVEQQIRSHYSVAQLGDKLNPERWILSPSDFGFHNILEDKGDLYFLDFEYAGWDDPVKLICDFACQPQVPVSLVQAESFREYLAFWLDIDQERTYLLLPLYRLKWCCILLNEFRSQDLQRRQHAGGNHDNILEQQLQKAQNYFYQHLGDG
jgi:hypothetical protein